MSWKIENVEKRFKSSASIWVMDAPEEGGRKQGYETRMDSLLEGEVYEQKNVDVFT